MRRFPEWLFRMIKYHTYYFKFLSRLARISSRFEMVISLEINMSKAHESCFHLKILPFFYIVLFHVMWHIPCFSVCLQRFPKHWSMFFEKSLPPPIIGFGTVWTVARAEFLYVPPTYIVSYHAKCFCLSNTGKILFSHWAGLFISPLPSYFWHLVILAFSYVSLNFF